MSNEEILQELQERLNRFREPKTFTWLIALLDKMLVDYERRYEKQKEYVKRNKVKIYQYQAKRRRQKKHAEVPEGIY